MRLTKEERRRLKCVCQENGHEVQECFKLHGYLDWYKRLKENRSTARVNYLDDGDDDTRSRSDGGRGTPMEPTIDMSKTIQSEVVGSRKS